MWGCDNVTMGPSLSAAVYSASGFDDGGPMNCDAGRSSVDIRSVPRLYILAPQTPNITFYMYAISGRVKPFPCQS